MTWKPSTVRKDVRVVQVGPLYLIARKTSYTLAAVPGWSRPVVDVPAKNEPAARKGAIDAARKLLSDWAAELDALEHQEAR